jgi:hypothetical protein
MSSSAATVGPEMEPKLITRSRAAQAMFGVVMVGLSGLALDVGWRPLWGLRWAVLALVVLLPSSAAAVVEHWETRGDAPAPDVDAGLLPARIDRTSRPADMPWYQLRIGMSVDGLASWDLRDSPHLLCAGKTGRGKTESINTLIAEAVDAGFETWIVDPKRVEFSSHRGHPHIRAVATNVDSMVATIEEVWEIMEARYQLIEDENLDPKDLPLDEFPPIMLVMDELHEWTDRVNEWWKENKAKVKGTGTQHPIVAKWKSIGRLGRSARVHMIVGIQRPDAEFMSGAARENFGARVAMGSMKTEEAATMMFGNAHVGRTLSSSTQGRCSCELEDGVVSEVQVFLTPRPARIRKLREVGAA